MNFIVVWLNMVMKAICNFKEWLTVSYPDFMTEGFWDKAKKMALPLAMMGSLGLGSSNLFGQNRGLTASKPTTSKVIPSADAQKQALALINQTFDVRKAVSPSQKAELARKMLEAAAETQDSASQYVLLTQAKSLALMGGDAACKKLKLYPWLS